ncbi:IlvD/Edd family dehydratase [Bryobacter aggregatus]|uniref:IlvD/Edd family dehydratase n=1 Tax=Bryobacter aggregatus TaxID=360054 RepID=UPI0004E16587|nr:IlvD/Edd family dehydratase [Bryobacter aggregatus]
MNRDRKFALRSQNWFQNPDNLGMTAVYLERYANYGLTREELQSGRPIIGIAQTGSDLSPCNRIHLDLESRVRDGIRDAGGVPFVFPVHPIFENCRRPTAALDRNLAYLGLVEILHGYFLDGVVLTTGCDKTTPACLMAAATVNTPAIVLSGGPMLNSYYNGKLAGSGMSVWEARRLHAAGEIDYDEFMERVMASAPSPGHCNTMGTASSMNSMAEALGMSLPGCAVIPAPYRERTQMAFRTGKRIVEMVRENLRPSDIMTREAFENAIVVCSAIGGSTNCPPHLVAIARHLGVNLKTKDWETIGHKIPLLANVQPAGEYLTESFHLAGGIPAIIGELMKAGKIHESARNVEGKTMGESYRGQGSKDPKVIHSYDKPLVEDAGFLVMSGNLFTSSLVKSSVIGPDFRQRFLSTPGEENIFTANAVVFEGPEDYHARINDADLQIDERSILVIRGCGPIGYPGAAEVVNMLPPDKLVRIGVSQLPTLGDGRQSGTSASASILNVSPEAAAGGNLAILKTGDKIRVNLNESRVDVLLSDEEIEERRKHIELPIAETQTPWQEFFRSHVGQLEFGGVLEFAVKYRNVGDNIPRHNH